MSWNDAEEIVVAANGQVSAAPVGTALPTTTVGALNVAFAGLGYISEDGVSFSSANETTDIPAWQSFDPVRTVKTSRTVQASFGVMQWNEETLPFALGGGAVTGTTPNFIYTPPGPDEGMDERSLVIDANDGDQHYRIVIARGIVVDAVETTLARGAAAILPVTFRMLAHPDGSSAPYRIITDAAGFEAGS